MTECKKNINSFWPNMKYKQRDLLTRQQTNYRTISSIPFFQRHCFYSIIAGFVWGGFILQLKKYIMIILPQFNSLHNTTIWYITFHQ